MNRISRKYSTKDPIRTLIANVCAVVLLMAMTAIPGTVSAQDVLSGPDTAAADAEKKTPAAKNTSITVDTEIEQRAVHIGRQFDITFTFNYPAGTKIYFPKKPETRPLVAVKMLTSDSNVIGTATSERHTLRVLAVKAGEIKLKPFEVPIVTSDGQAAMVMTPEVRVTVGSMIGNEEAPQLADPGSTVPVVVRNDLLVWGLAALLTAVFTALLAVAAYRKWRAWADAHKPPPPPVPPHETAYRRLGEIEAMGLIDSRDFKTLALLVSEVIKEFIGARLDFSGEESTTWEMMKAVSLHAPDRQLGRLDPNEVEDYLGLCDLIKFAKFTPSVNDATSLLRRSRSIVDDVMMSAFTPEKITVTGDDASPNAALAEKVPTESNPFEMTEEDSKLIDETPVNENLSAAERTETGETGPKPFEKSQPDERGNK